MQWRERLKLQYVVGSLRGSHLIRFYRLFFTEELSHITIKNRDGDKLKKTGSCSSGENFKNFSTDHEGETEMRGYSCDAPDAASISYKLNENVYLNELTTNDEPIEQSGFFINGLWVPISQVQNIDNVNQAFPDAFRTFSLVGHQSSTVLSSAYPRFLTFHALDVPFQSNFFIPNNNHYFYYLTRYQTKLANVPTTEQSNYLQNTADYSNYEMSSSNASVPTDYAAASESPKPVTDITTTNARLETAIESNNIYEDIKDQTYMTNLPYKDPDIHAAYRHPGYGFGHPVCNTPLYVVFPPVQSHAYTTSSWSAGHLKRRKRRRKGYAEYAIIPKKKNGSQNVSNQDLVTQDNYTKNSSDESKLNTSDVNVHRNSDAQNNDDDHYLPPIHGRQKKSTPVLGTKTDKKCIPHFVKQDKTLNYVNNLVENIIQQGIRKFITFNHRDETFNLDFDSIALNETVEIIEDANIYGITVKEGRLLNKIAEKSTNTIPALHCDYKYFQTENSDLKQHKKDPQKQRDKKQNVPADTLRNKNAISNTSNEENLQNYILPTITDKLKNTNVSSCNSESNGTLPESQLKMNVPHVHKKIFSCSQSENIGSHEEPKSQIYGTPMKEENFNTSSKNILSRSFSTICDKNPKNYTEMITKDENLNASSIQSDDQNVCDKFNTSLNVIESVDSVQKNNFIDTPGKDNSENNYASTRSWALYNELHDNKRNEESPSSQCSFMSHSINSEVLIRETELELKKLHQLTSNSNQGIYKLAYDENIADDISETENLEVEYAAHKAELRCPQSCKNLQPEVYRNEIIVHEMDSGSDAGSEDVELLPHRYESDTAKGCTKHVYVNNLSLAVELLRTRESLPYDDEFKMIVNDEAENQCEAKNFQSVNRKPSLGKVNKGFIGDTKSISKAHSANITTCHHPEISSQRSSDLPQDTLLRDELKPKQLRLSIADSGVQSEESEDDIGEEVKKTVEKSNEPMHNADASFRRFGIQTRQRFNIYTPRTNVMNPCFCCIIM